MRTYRGTEKAEVGLYFNAREWAFTSMDDAGPLPGTASDRYRKVPMLALLIVGPILGLVYAVFLPLIGIAMVAWFIGVKLTHALAAVARRSARLVRPGWEPALAFLSRPKKANDTGKEAAGDEWAEKVRKELERDQRDR